MPRFRAVLTPATWWSSTASTSCGRVPRWTSPWRTRPATARAAPATRAGGPGKRGHEPVEAFHPAAHRDVAADGGPAARRPLRLPPTPRLGTAGGGLPDDPGDHLLSRRQPGRHGLGRHRAARTPVRPSAGPEPDDLHQLRGEL